MLITLKLSRSILVLVIYVIYNSLISWQLSLTLEEAGQWTKGGCGVIIALASFTGFVIQFLIVLFGYKEKSWITDISWCDVPMLAFILTTIWQFGVGLGFSYENARLKTNTPQNVIETTMELFNNSTTFKNVTPPVKEGCNTSCLLNVRRNINKPRGTRGVAPPLMSIGMLPPLY